KVAGRLGDIDQLAGVAATLGGLSKWAVPLLAAGGGSGLLALAFALVAFVRTSRRIRAELEQRQERDDFRGPRLADFTAEELPPPAQVVREKHSYIGYQAPCKKCAAHLQAVDEMVRRQPGVAGTIETLNAFTDQYLSGMK